SDQPPIADMMASLFSDGFGLPVSWRETKSLNTCENARFSAELLRRDGIDARVIDLHTVKPIDRALLVQAAEETGLLVTVEEHPVRGGLGGAVAEALGDGCPVPMRILGVPDACGEPAPTRQERLRRCGVDAPGIAASARRALAGWKGERA
ncbi:MAG: hypothetical protein JOZ15_13765, partial [Acidobacteria bacterium]|nr:hypothetical protein [Acidobacteriota bacterium]